LDIEIVDIGGQELINVLKCELVIENEPTHLHVEAYSYTPAMTG
jgi:hypothetical protein